MLETQLLHFLLQLVKGLVQIVIDDGQVKVVAVRPADPCALVHSLLQIVLLLDESVYLNRKNHVH